MLRKIKIMAVFVAFILMFTVLSQAKAQSSDVMCTFFYRDYAGITIKVDATNETDPNGNLIVKLWLNCTATGVHIEQLNITVYGFIEGEQQTPLNSNNTCVLEDKLLDFNQTSEHEITVYVPSNVWGVAHAELILEYSIQEELFKKVENFPITTVRNVEFEELKEAYKKLNETFSQLNQTFAESFGMNLTLKDVLNLNETYWELMQKYTTLEGGLNELNNTKFAVGVLAVTTIFFVATTFYLVMRKPKQYW